VLLDQLEPSRSRHRVIVEARNDIAGRIVKTDALRGHVARDENRTRLQLKSGIFVRRKKRARLLVGISQDEDNLVGATRLRSETLQAARERERTPVGGYDDRDAIQLS
jgi:hypothetical protein